jgi:DNA polymerase-3 subunit alpha
MVRFRFLVKAWIGQQGDINKIMGTHIDFVDLHLHSTYSNLDGFGTPIQIVERAKAIGRKTIALTDHGSVSGLVQLKKACVANEVKPIYGCEFYIVDSLDKMFAEKQRRKNHITVLASNLVGYRNLLKLSGDAYQKGFYYRPTIDKELLFEKQDGLIVFSGCWSGAMQDLLKEGKTQEAEALAKEFQQVFGDRYYLETQHFPLFRATIDSFQHVSEKLDIPMVLTCDPHYLTRDQAPIQEILHAIRDRRQFDKEKIIRGAYQWPANDLLWAVKELFPKMPWEQLFENVCEVGARCNVEMTLGGAPKFPKSEGERIGILFLEKCKEGISHRNLDNAGEVYRARFKKEYDLIIGKDFADYFLIVADMVKWAKDSGIFVGPARGSAAGSLICFLLGITEINPLDHDLMFERFIDETRYDLPDIDIDFEDERRDEVKQYMVSKYGYDKICNVPTFAAFKGKNSLDEIGKVFKIPAGEINTIKKYLISRSGADMRAELTISDTFEMSPEAKAISEKYSDLHYAEVLEGQLRHMSKHAAGLIVGDRPLDEVIALYEKDGQILGSVEMKDASSLGLLKIDVLGIKELTILRSVCEMIGWTSKDLYAISVNDKKTLEGFKRLDVSGVFQFDGDSTKSVLRQLPTLDFEQLTACVTLSKPGPAHSGGTSHYLAYARGDKTRGGFDWHPTLRKITESTYYQIIYQEQVLAIVREVGDMSWTAANQIRGFMSKSKGEAAFEAFWPAFKEGALKNQFSEKEARKVWESMKTMGRWAFNKSHAVSYAMLAFWSMYMKQNHTLEFYAARLMKESDKDKTLRLLMEINKRGIAIYPPVLGKSKEKWIIENKGLRAGLLEVKGIGAKVATALVSDDYRTIEDFKTKKNRGVTKKTLANLEAIDAFGDGIDDFFDIRKFDVLDIISPNRQILFDIRDYDSAYDIEISGIFKEMNYKDVHEEARSRGRPTNNIKDPNIAKYAMLLLEDDTDRCLVNVNRYLFNKIGQQIWDAYNNGYFVVIKGKKVGGWRIVRCKEVKVYDKDGQQI